jgi:hypothetical protein
MTITDRSIVSHPIRPATWLRRGLLAAYLASLTIVSGLLIANGPQVHAAFEAHKARIVEAENRDFCSKFGIASDASRFAECADGLNAIRLRHEQRSADLFF